MDSMDIERRADIIHNVDAQECESCGRTIVDDAASNGAWWIDSHLERAEDGEVVEIAEIRCPRCW